MDDALVVGGLEGIGNLARDHQSLGQRQPRSFVSQPRCGRLQPLTERLALHQLQHQRVKPVRVLDAVNGRDVRMVQRREEPCFALEPREPFGVAREERRENLDGDLATERRVPCPVHLAHATRPER